MATGTTVELDIELQRRLERIAEARHESAGKVIGDAIQEFVVEAGETAEFGTYEHIVAGIQGRVSTPA